MATPTLETYFSRPPILTDVQLVIYGGKDGLGRELEPLEFEFASKGCDSKNLAYARSTAAWQMRTHFIMRDREKTLASEPEMERAA